MFFWVMGSIMGPECDLGAPRRQFKVLGAIRGFGGNFMGSQGAIVGLGGQLWVLGVIKGALGPLGCSQGGNYRVLGGN